MAKLRGIFARVSLKLLAFLIVVALAATVFLFSRREPASAGRTISDWLQVAEHWASSESERSAADRAIKQIGSNAVPVLLRKLTSSAAFESQQQAQRGFRIIGEDANAAVGRLRELLSDPAHATNASRCLTYIHTADALNAFVSGLEDANPATRLLCLNGMASYDDEALRPFTQNIKSLIDDTDGPVVRVALHLVRGLLIEEDWVEVSLLKLEDRRPVVQQEALQNLLNGPESAMPAIAKCLSSIDAENRALATNILIYLNPCRAAEFGVFTNDIPHWILEGYERRTARSRIDSAESR